MSTGTKHDVGKLRWSLLPRGSVPDIIKVLEFGAAKYGAYNWQSVPNASTRYYDAMMRHMEAWHQGEATDPESLHPHLAHAGCCLLFLLWLDEQGQDGPGKEFCQCDTGKYPSTIQIGVGAPKLCAACLKPFHQD